MLHVPVGANSYSLTTPSWGTTRPAVANGTAVTPATAAYGAWAALGTALTSDAYGILININSNAGSAASRNTVTKIGVDYAGGTAYTDLITGLLSGGAGAYNIIGQWYFFPVFIPAGSTLAAAGRGSVTTAYRVGSIVSQRPSNPSAIRKGSFVETIGIGTTAGVTITPGTTADGAWTTIGTTTKRCWWWQLGLQITTGDTAWGANALHIDIAVGDATTKDIIITDYLIGTDTTENMYNPPLTFGVEWDVPAGSTIYARVQNSGTNDAYTLAVYGCGG